MTLYLCELAERCSNSDCHHRIPHREEVTPSGVNVCIIRFPCLTHDRHVRCLICEEEEVYFIKKKKK
jgi:hypothetical protein